MKSIFDYNEIYEDEDVRDANNAEDVMWATIIFAVAIIGLCLYF